jgi:hypothetical protein
MTGPAIGQASAASAIILAELPEQPAVAVSRHRATRSSLYNSGSISMWEVVMHLARVFTAHGAPAVSQLLARVPASIDRDLCKELAVLLFALAKDAKRAKVVVEFNALGTAWNDVKAASRTAATQQKLDFSGE